MSRIKPLIKRMIAAREQAAALMIISAQLLEEARRMNQRLKRREHAAKK